ncbi:MAG: hypothetical protein WC858_05645 [Parcubacteria group bacterium]|jgi:hypothetical protein
MEQKNENTTPEEEKNIPTKNSNKALFWVLGGCLALLIIAGLITAGFVYWGYKQIKNETKQNQLKLEERQVQIKNLEKQAEQAKEQSESFSEEAPVAVAPQPTVAEEPAQSFPENSERQIGYIKKVYAKGGKNYLNIDYIQWLSGDAAEKAMREDGACPKAGECVVLNDYYIRNVNALIRTFEISPEAQITMQTYDVEATGQIQSQTINLAQFGQIWISNQKLSLREVPYIVEIQNQQIIKINEQYIP